VNKKSNQPSRGKILVIEDDERARGLLRTRLESFGFEVMCADSGDQGLKLARQEKPSLIIVDIMLPNMNGYQICRLLKFDKRFENIPIIILTGLQQSKNFQTAEEVHADSFLTKPYRAQELLETIEKLLGKEKAEEKPPNPSLGLIWLDGTKIAK